MVKKCLTKIYTRNFSNLVLNQEILVLWLLKELKKELKLYNNKGKKKKWVYIDLNYNWIIFNTCNLIFFFIKIHF